MIATTLAIATPVVATLSYLTYATVAPACGLWGPVTARGPSGTRRIALTFDDGPTPGGSDRILEALRDAKVRATFFVVGANCRRHPELLRRMHDEGHQLANHSFDHPHFGVMRRGAYWERQICETDEVIESVLGVRPAVFRPPMGVRTWHTLRAAQESGHAIVTWSRRAIDGLPTTSAKILRRLRDPADGEILLLHDGVEPNARHADRSATIAAVAPLLQRVVEQGLSAVRLDELTALPAYQSAR